MQGGSAIILNFQKYTNKIMQEGFAKFSRNFQSINIKRLKAM